MFDLRQSTAVVIVAGPFLDKSDAVTPLTSLALQAGRLVKDGSAGSAFTPTSWVHDGSGYYLVGVGADAVDTRGALRLHFDDAAAYLPVSEDFRVLGQAVYDVLYGTVAPSTYAGNPTPTPPTPTPAVLDAVLGQNADAAMRRAALSSILSAACDVLMSTGSGTIVVRAGDGPGTTQVMATVDGSA